MMWFNLIKSVEQTGNSIPPRIWKRMTRVKQKSHNMVMSAGVDAKLVDENRIQYTKQIDGVTLRVMEQVQSLSDLGMIGDVSLHYGNRELLICVLCVNYMGTSGDNIASLFMIGRGLEIIDLGIKLIKKFNISMNKLRFEVIYSLSDPIKFINDNREIIGEEYLRSRKDALPFEIVREIMREL